MPSRAADATIKGYYYQFDKTILQILQAGDDDTIIVEHIEDISLETPSETTATQCKYIPSKAPTNSTIREAVIPMLDDFCGRDNCPETIQYRLYGYFAVEPEKLRFTLAELKEMLTFTEKGDKVVYHEVNAIVDDVLDAFVIRFAIESGLEFDLQQSTVLESLRTHFKCSPLEAEYMYYNNALRHVLDLCIQPSVEDRTVKRRDFLQKINVRTSLYNRWYIDMKGRAAYHKLVAEMIYVKQALNPQKDRYIVVDEHILSNADGGHLGAAFIQNTVHDYYRIGKAFYNTRPLTFVVDAAAELVLNIKRELVALDVPFNDGCEHIEFSSVIFNRDPIVNTKRGSEQIEKSSYHVRILSSDTFLRNIDTITHPAIALYFSNGGSSLEYHNKYFPSPRTQVLAIDAQSVDEIAAILKKGLKANV